MIWGQREFSVSYSKILFGGDTYYIIKRTSLDNDLFEYYLEKKDYSKICYIIGSEKEVDDKILKKLCIEEIYKNEVEEDIWN